MQQQHFMARTQMLNSLISVTERTLNNSDAYQSFGHGGNRGCHHMPENQQIKRNRRTNRNKESGVRLRKQTNIVVNLHQINLH
eukprot:9551758-Ditylum_brightwellii.AAC.1